MKKYNILTAIGLIIGIATFAIDYVYDIPMMVQSVIEVIAAVIMIVGLYYRRHE